MMTEERTKANVRVLKLAYGGLLVALGILLPQAFHIFGQNAGMIFLPIQIPVLFAGMLLGPYYGGLIGILVPLFSSVLTGMPPVPKVYFMFAELMAYGIVTGWMIKKTNVYASCAVTGFFSAFLNTLFFMTALVVMFGNTEVIQNLMGGRNVIIGCCMMVGVNAISEMVSSTIITAAVGTALSKAHLIPASQIAKPDTAA